MIIINTYFSLIGSSLGAYLLCIILFKGKVKMEYIIYSSLTGGVLMASCSDLIYEFY